MDKKKITNMEVNKTNRNRIFCYIRKHDSVSNPDIAYGLNISLPTVTQMTKELMEKCLDAYCSASRLSDAAEGKLEKFFSALKEGEEEASGLWGRHWERRCM